MAEEVRIDLKSTADTSGFDKMGAASEKAGVGIGAASKASKDLSQELGKTVAVGSATKEFLGAVRDVGKGGADSLFAMGRAALSFGNIIKTVLVSSGPVGWAVAALGALAGAAIILREALKPAGESAAEAAEKVSALNQQKLASIDLEVGRLSVALKAADTQAAALRASLDKIDDARMANELRVLGKRSDLTAEQKAEQEFLVRDRYQQRKEQRQADAAEQSVANAEKIAAAEKQRSDAAQAEFERLDTERRRREADAAALPELAKQKRDLGSFRSKLPSESSEDYDVFKGQWRDTDTKYWAALARTKADEDSAATFRKEYDSSRTRYKGSDGGGGVKAEYEKAEAAAEQARFQKKLLDDERAALATEGAAGARLDYRGTDPRRSPAAVKVNKQIVDLTDAARNGQSLGDLLALDTPEAKARREEARKKQVEEMQRAPESTWRGRAASGFPVDSDVFKEAFPQAKPLPQPRADLQPVTDSLNKAADAAEQAPDAKPAVDAADRLAKATETSATEQAAALAQVVSALSAATAVAAQSVEMSSALAGKIVALQQRLNTLSQQQAAARQRISS